jgi:hypothetical protein
MLYYKSSASERCETHGEICSLKLVQLRKRSSLTHTAGAQWLDANHCKKWILVGNPLRCTVILVWYI